MIKQDRGDPRMDPSLTWLGIPKNEKAEESDD